MTTRIEANGETLIIHNKYKRTILGKTDPFLFVWTRDMKTGLKSLFGASFRKKDNDYTVIMDGNTLTPTEIEDAVTFTIGGKKLEILDETKKPIYTAFWSET